MAKINFSSFMHRQKISQAELADILNVHQSSVSQYVNGKSGILFDKILILVEMGMTPEELFGDELGQQVRDRVISDYLSKAKNQNDKTPFDLVKEGLVEILKKI